MTKERALRRAAQRRAWADAAEAKAAQLQKEYDDDPRSNDWAFWSEPIKIGHHSERRHRRARELLNNKKQRIFDLLDKAKMHRQKADNLERFASTHKGDAERRRQAEREALDSILGVGSRVHSIIYRRDGEITKVFPKSYRVKFSEDWSVTMEKTFVQPID